MRDNEKFMHTLSNQTEIEMGDTSLISLKSFSQDARVKGTLSESIEYVVLLTFLPCLLAYPLVLSNSSSLKKEKSFFRDEVYTLCKSTELLMHTLFQQRLLTLKLEYCVEERTRVYYYSKSIFFRI